LIETITGVILAGGKSSRMGKDKALLPYKGKPLIQTVLERMRTVFSKVVVSVQPDDAFGDLKVDRVADHYPGSGPLGGITSVMEKGEEHIFCVACDMPFVNPGLMEYICSLDGFDAVIPVWQDRLQVLHALYSRTMLPLFQAALQGGQLRISDAFSKANIRYIPDREIRNIDPDGASFSNLNTPADYEELLRIHPL